MMPSALVRLVQASVTMALMVFQVIRLTAMKGR
jgi:hypothetical protein